VVVNDFGTSMLGEHDASPADDVVAEIRDSGGEAVANYGDVADWDDSRALISQAVQEWGQLDILVNNAGILRGGMLFNMSENDWDSVIRVHLKGHFCMLRHSAEYWREKAKLDGGVYGRVIDTSSEAFLSLHGPGRGNYSAAKAGIVLLTLDAALALRPYGVTANVICPRARTRMTQDFAGVGNPKGGWDPLAPENVAPLVAYLGSPASQRISGQVFWVYGKKIHVLAGPTIDTTFSTDEPWTSATVADSLTGFFADREPIVDGFCYRPTGPDQRSGPDLRSSFG
jgi:3-oxoacyl-[acyl-carrier protein] reductase